ncbi:MAG: hypothetical protein COW65_05265 [Cytophagales bacterium CG18_big_fil_WC_8_21_14_2_50_42_9]|nr:MAG: hypothetical protein COW65_05265 [Cytophagales bacterium CG18_big_fil_WC_8_21_14_2_50_42_9]
MKYVLTICLLTVLSFLACQVSAQGLGAPRSAIISENGPNFTTGRTNSGLIAITYEHTGATHKLRSAYFFNADDVCIAIMTAWPAADANGIIKRFNEKYVKVSEGRVISYKDYENSAIFEVEIEENFVFITIKKAS